MVGIVYNVQPEPLDPARTRWVDAGNLRIGVEYREAWAEIEQGSPEGGFSDRGVSIHVLAKDDGHEYLRFDAFEGDPHYHYVWPSGDHNNVVRYDDHANGPMAPWVLTRLRTALGSMLREAHGDRLVDGLDPAALEHALTELEHLVAS
jgi:hypothetical protein